jgi:hypothetical protein
MKNIKSVILIIVILLLIINCNNKILRPSVPYEVITMYPHHDLQYYKAAGAVFNPITDVNYYLLQFNKLNTIPSVIDTIKFNDTLIVNWSQRHYYHDSSSVIYPEGSVLPYTESVYDTLYNNILTYETAGDVSKVTAKISLPLSPGAYELYIWCQPIDTKEKRSYRCFPAKFLLIEDKSPVTPYMIRIEIIKKI